MTIITSAIEYYRLADYSLIEEKLTFTKKYNSIDLSFTSQWLLWTKIMTIHNYYFFS